MADINFGLSNDEVEIINILEQWDSLAIEIHQRKNNKKRQIDVRRKMLTQDLINHIRSLFTIMLYLDDIRTYYRLLKLLSHNTIVQLIRFMGQNTGYTKYNSFGYHGLLSIFSYKGKLNPVNGSDMVVDRNTELGMIPKPEHFAVIEALRSFEDLYKFNETSNENEYDKISLEKIDIWLQENDITTRIKSASKQR